jgi:hypothetical protein
MAKDLCRCCRFCRIFSKEVTTMPIKKIRLSRAEKARYLARAGELKAAQVDCEVPDDWQETSQDLDIFTAAPGGNILCEIPSGVTAYAIWVHLTALRSNVRLEECRIESDWDLASIVLCQDHKGLYIVGQAVNLQAEDVLNHRIENGLCFHDRGDVAEGWVVATGHKPIPDKYRNWMITELCLRFTDQFGHDHCAYAEAALERSARSRNSDSRVRKSPGLFEVGNPGNEIWSREVPTSTPSRQPEGPGGTHYQRG